MQDQVKFQEALENIKKIAGEHEQKITEKDIESCLSGFQLSDEQKAFVYQYLSALKIEISGYEDAGINPFKVSEDETIYELNEEEQAYLKEYLQMAEDMQKGILTDKSVNETIELYLQNRVCKEELLCKLMFLCAEVSKEYAGEGVLLSDLIQESMIGAMMAVDTLDLRDDSISGEEYIRAGIRESLEQMIQEDRDSKEADQHILEKINHVADAIKELSEDLDRKVSIEELSAYLEMDIEEITEVLKLTGEEFETQPEPSTEEKDSYGYAGLDDFKVF